MEQPPHGNTRTEHSSKQLPSRMEQPPRGNTRTEHSSKRLPSRMEQPPRGNTRTEQSSHAHLPPHTRSPQPSATRLNLQKSDTENDEEPWASAPGDAGTRRRRDIPQELHKRLGHMHAARCLAKSVGFRMVFGVGDLKLSFCVVISVFQGTTNTLE